MYNSATTFNFYLQSKLDLISQELSQEFNLFTDEGAFLQYPAVVVNYLEEGAPHPTMNMDFHLIELKTMVLKADTRTSRLLKQKLKAKLGFTKQNHMKRVKIPKLDYVDDFENPVPIPGQNLLLDQIPGMGFSNEDDTDTDLRTNKMLLMLLYNPDE